MKNFIINNVNILDECGLFNKEMYDILSDWYGYILIAIPILVIVLCMTDIAKAVMAQDEKAVKEAQSRALKRLIIGVIIFFIPILVNVLIGYVSGLPLGDTCGIEEVR